jgi:hypothetical protein
MSVNANQVEDVPPKAGGIVQESSAAPVIEQTEQVIRSKTGVEQSERVVTDAAGGVEHRYRIVHDVAAEHLIRVAKACQIVWLCAALVETLIGLRVVLKVIGANPDSPFAGFVYNGAALFLAPFYGLTGSPTAGGSVLEVPAIIALLLYAFLAWSVVRIIRLLFDRPMTRSSSTYDRSRV